jgi:hypothetical protein
MARIEWDFSQVWSPLYFSQKFTGTLDPSTNPGVEEVAYLYENHPRFRQPSKEGLPIPKFLLREKNEIIFLTTSNRRKLEDQKQSHFMWVRYYVGDTILQVAADGSGGSEEKTVKSLMRQVFPDDPWAKEELTIDTTRSAVLLENIENLEFLFWNKATKKWESNLATIVDGEALWRGMQVNLTWLDSKGLERKTSRWLRPLWPSAIPQDPASGATGGNQGGGVQGGAQAGAQGGAQGGTPAGAQGGGAEEGEE